MELKNFIGKTVISTNSNKRYMISKINSPYIAVLDETPDARGNRACYHFTTINGDPFSRGTLIFEDSSLKAPFIAAYDAYCRTQTARYEEMHYWSRKD